MSQILVIDDEPSICWGFREFLSEDGHEVSVASSAEEALRTVDRIRPDAVVLDVRLPGMDGLTAIQKLREKIGDVPIIVITAFGNLETAVRAVREGAFDYIPKPFDLDQAASLIERALLSNQARLASAVAVPAEIVQDSLIGGSPAMQQIFKQIALVAASDVPVLITGESGTGKEVVARAIHRHSSRQSGPFLPICLAALSPGLVESEMFGHSKGSFTGATHDRRGLLELADGGTVLLDEIGDTQPGLQVKLLRTLEQREITPVGDARPRPINVRIIAATNRPLPELIRSGEFREDLYFRLSVFHIHLPPLRDRLDDIPLLAEHFLRRCQTGTTSATLADDVVQQLQQRPWTGNVRELRNCIEHAAILARGKPLRPEHLPAPFVANLAPAATNAAQAADSQDLNALIAAWCRRDVGRLIEQGTTISDVYERFLGLTEPALLTAILQLCDFNRAAAAQLLGIHRTTLRQKLRKHGLEK